MARFGLPLPLFYPSSGSYICSETSVSSTGLRVALSRGKSVWVVSTSEILGRRLVYTLYSVFIIGCCLSIFNPLKPNDRYRGRTAPLTSKRCILYIYSTNIGTEYFKHSIYSPFFPLESAVCFIILTYLVSCIIHILYTGVLKFKKK